MAIGGVVIQFIAKTASAVRDIDFLARSADDASDEIDDLDRSLGSVRFDQAGQAAAGLGRDLNTAEDGFDSLAREVDDTADQFARNMDRMSGSVRDASGDIDVQASKMRSDMGEAGRETGSEFVSNIAEGIGSGSANLNDVVTGTLGGLTNLAASLTGPVGLAAAGAAAGIGLMWGKMRAEAEKAAEQIAGLIETLEDTEDQAEKIRKQKIFEQWLDDARKMPEQLSLMVGGLQNAEIKAEDFSEAITGNEEAAAKVVAQLEEQVRTIEASAAGEYGLTYEQQKYVEGLEIAIDEIKTQNQNLQAAKGHHEDINWLQGESKKKQQGVTAEIGRSKTAAKQLGDELDDAVRNRSMQVKVHAMGTGGGGGASTGGGSGYPAGPRSMNYAMGTVTPIQPSIALVTREQIYRAVRDLIIEGDARNGRQPA